VLNINTKANEGLEVVAVEGEIDMEVSPQLRDVLLAVFGKDPKAIVVDLSAVPYIDSSGVATLVEGLQWSKEREKRFVLVGLQENVSNTLRLAKLDRFFEVRPSEEDAVASISGKA
jgi:anti-sigma B factor antagonist